MDRRTIRRVAAAADELYAAGHLLHAFATLNALLEPPIAIPQCYRGDEICVRVRAAEILLESDPSTSHVEAAKLDLVHAVLSPMFSRRFFENITIQPLVWEQGGQVNNSDVTEGGVTTVVGDGSAAKLGNCAALANEGQHKEYGDGEASEDEREYDNVTPIALVCKAYALNAAVHRRWLRYAQAIKLLEAARHWCTVTFASRLSTDPGAEATDEVAHAEDAERCFCEAYLAVELCRVYHAQLMTAVGTTAVCGVNSIAALRQTRRQALDGILRSSKDYAKFVEQHSINVIKKGHRPSFLCFSSKQNSFCISAAARVLCQYYCCALAFDYRLSDVTEQLQQCECHFGPSPELSQMQLLTMIALPNVESSLTTANNGPLPEQSRIGTGGTDTKKARWVSDGVLSALGAYIKLHVAVVTGRAVESDMCGGSGAENGDIGRLFELTLESIDEQMTLLTTATQRGASGTGVAQSLICSTPLSNIRLLVILKCAALLTMIHYELSQLHVGAAVRHLSQLRQYMAVFAKDTQRMLTYYHLLAAQTAAMLSLRRIPGNAVATDGEGQPQVEADNVDGDQKPLGHVSVLCGEDELEETAGFDVGLPYAHLRAAEAVVAHAVQPCNPSTKLLLSLMKGVLLQHASHTAAVLQLVKGGFAVSSLPVNQRRRCASAIEEMVEVLRVKEVEATVKQNTEEVENGSLDRKKVEEMPRGAWSVDNKVLLLMLQGLVALTEAKDGPTANQLFTEAAMQAVKRFGTRSRITVECLHGLSMARQECEQVQLLLHGDLLSYPVSADNLVDMLNNTNIIEGTAQRCFNLVVRLASHASPVVLLQCVSNTVVITKENGWNEVVSRWDNEVHHVCTALREDLTRALSLQ